MDSTATELTGGGCPELDSSSDGFGGCLGLLSLVTLLLTVCKSGFGVAAIAQMLMFVDKQCWSDCGQQRKPSKCTKLISSSQSGPPLKAAQACE